MNVSTIDSHVESSDDTANITTHTLCQYHTKTCLPHFHTAAHVPRKCPCKMPCVRHLNAWAPVLQKPSDTLELA